MTTEVLNKDKVQNTHSISVTISKDINLLEEWNKLDDTKKYYNMEQMSNKALKMLLEITVEECSSMLE